MNFPEIVYNHSPVLFQNALCSLYGYKEKRLRFSKDFFNLLEEYKETDFFDANQLAVYQAKKLTCILKNAADNTPYYRCKIDSGLSAKNCFDFLKKLPIITKITLRESKNEFLNTASVKPIIFKTSGSTGNPLSFYKDSKSIAAQWAIWFRHRARFDCHQGDLHVNFTGKPLVPPNQDRPPYWRYNKPFNQFLIPMQCVDNEKIEDIVGFLSSLNPKFYSGYPSILAEVARLSTKNGLSLPDSSKPKYIFTGAEPVLDDQREIIEAWSGATVSDQYGMTEGVCNASKCPNGNYHEDFEFGYIEKGEPELLSDGAIRAKIIATSFTNKAFSFIRYDTGDIAVWEPSSYICGCGRHSPVIRMIEGRSEDYVITPENRRIMRFDYIFKDSIELNEAQVLQEELGEIKIKYVLKGNAKLDRERLVKSIKKYISPTIRVVFDEVNTIPRERNGKFRSVKSLLSKA